MQFHIFRCFSNLNSSSVKTWLMYKVSNRGSQYFSHQEKISMEIKFSSMLFCSCIFANLIILESYNYLSFKMHLLWCGKHNQYLVYCNQCLWIHSGVQSKKNHHWGQLIILLGGLWVQFTLVSPAIISQDWFLFLLIGLVGKQLTGRRIYSFCMSPDFVYLFTPMTARTVCYLVKKKTLCIQCIFCIYVFSVHTFSQQFFRKKWLGLMSRYSSS